MTLSEELEVFLKIDRNVNTVSLEVILTWNAQIVHCTSEDKKKIPAMGWTCGKASAQLNVQTHFFLSSSEPKFHLCRKVDLIGWGKVSVIQFSWERMPHTRLAAGSGHSDCHC